MKRKSKDKKKESTKEDKDDVKSKIVKKQMQQKQAKKKQKKSKHNTFRENILLYGMLLSLIGFIIWCVITPPVPVPKNKAAKASSKKTDSKKSRFDQFTVLDVIPHDTKAFTQGLTYHDGKIYESTGGFQGDSQVRIINPTNGTEIYRNISLANDVFGEGLTYFTDSEGNPRLLQLTWKNQIGYIYDLDLNLIREFKYETISKEGWGVTYNKRKEEFIVSDGTSMLYMWDRDTLEETRRVNVTLTWADANGTLTTEALSYLNELEFWNRQVLANLWYEDYIVAINPNTGLVTNSFDFSKLYTNEDKRGEHDVFNGISVVNTEKANDQLLVTGKNWPNMYRIQIH